jgi:1-deoxy-D-xylulose-5-phosphate synthase
MDFLDASVKVSMTRLDTAHSSTSISAAAVRYGTWLYIIKVNRKVAVAVIGDSAMTGGMAFEAMNHAGT